MPLMIDTDVAIHLRDGDPAISARLREAGMTPVISVVTLCELEAGAANDALRRQRLDQMLRLVPVLPFTGDEAARYGEIVVAGRHDRRRVLDRMIAAQAIVAGLPLATINGRDFADVPGLELQMWEVPGGGAA